MDKFESLKTKLFNSKVGVTIIIIFIVISQLDNFITSCKNIFKNTSQFIISLQSEELSDNSLIDETQKLSVEIFTFAQERMAESNKYIYKENNSNDDFYENSLNMVNHLNETISLYYQNYLNKVTFLRNEYLKRDIKSKDLEFYYKNPTNYLGIQNVAKSLIELSNKLKIKIHNENKNK